jgi:hypothetical protein
LISHIFLNKQLSPFFHPASPDLLHWACAALRLLTEPSTFFAPLERDSVPAPLLQMLENSLGVDLDAHDLGEFSAAMDLVSGAILDGGRVIADAAAAVVEMARDSATESWVVVYDLFLNLIFVVNVVVEVPILTTFFLFCSSTLSLSVAASAASLLKVPVNIANYAAGQVGIRMRVALLSGGAAGGGSELGSFVTRFALPITEIACQRVSAGGEPAKMCVPPPPPVFLIWSVEGCRFFVRKVLDWTGLFTNPDLYYYYYYYYFHSPAGRGCSRTPSRCCASRRGACGPRTPCSPGSAVSIRRRRLPRR